MFTSRTLYLFILGDLALICWTGTRQRIAQTIIMDDWFAPWNPHSQLEQAADALRSREDPVQEEGYIAVTWVSLISAGLGTSRELSQFLMFLPMGPGGVMGKHS